MQHDRDGLDSLASTTTTSYFSSSTNTNRKSKKLAYMLKCLLRKLFTKLARILLHFFYGYQFFQNCFIDNHGIG
jgi:thiamine transporter ThiT